MIIMPIKNIKDLNESKIYIINRDGSETEINQEIKELKPRFSFFWQRIIYRIKYRKLIKSKKFKLKFKNIIIK